MQVLCLQVVRANEEVHEAVCENFAALTTGLLPGMVSQSGLWAALKRRGALSEPTTASRPRVLKAVLFKA